MPILQFEVNKKQLENIDILMKEVGVDSRKDLFNNALTALQWMVKQKKEDRSVGSLSKDDSNYKELNMPILTNIRKDC